MRPSIWLGALPGLALIWLAWPPAAGNDDAPLSERRLTEQREAATSRTGAAGPAAGIAPATHAAHRLVFIEEEGIVSAIDGSATSANPFAAGVAAPDLYPGPDLGVDPEQMRRDNPPRWGEPG